MGRFRHSSANRGEAHPVYASSSSVYGSNTKIPFGEQMLGKKAITNLLPMKPGDVSTTFADTHRLQALVDFAPYTPLAEGIARFVEWYREFVGTAV